MNNNVFVSFTELSLFFVVLMLICSGYEPVSGARGGACHSRALAFESVDISECLGVEFDKSAGFQKPTTINKIEEREKDRIPKKTRQSAKWWVIVYQAWAKYRNTQIETLGGEYTSVPVDLSTTPLKK